MISHGRSRRPPKVIAQATVAGLEMVRTAREAASELTEKNVAVASPNRMLITSHPSRSGLGGHARFLV